MGAHWGPGGARRSRTHRGMSNVVPTIGAAGNFSLGVRGAADPLSRAGDSGWRLGGFFSSPGSKKESDTIRAYLKQAREELSKRIVDRLYGEDGAR